jgi:hypothetical protein
MEKERTRKPGRQRRSAAEKGLTAGKGPTDDGVSRSVLAIKTDHGGTPLKTNYTKNRRFREYPFGAPDKGQPELTPANAL